jgi:hypothetical protein
MVIHKIKKALSRLRKPKQNEHIIAFSDIHKPIVIDQRYPEKFHHKPIKVSAPATIEPSTTRDVKLTKVKHKSRKTTRRLVGRLMKKKRK